MSPTRIRTILEMIKFEHSVFALPFALTGALLAARYAPIPGAAPGWPSWRQIVWIIVAMVGARSAAMTMNRIIDLRYDRENPRTRTRALATGALSVGFAWAFAAGRCGGAGDRGVAIESARVRTFSRRARRAVFLLLHQALHVVVAPGAGILPGDVACGGVDRHCRARSTRAC